MSHPYTDAQRPFSARAEITDAKQGLMTLHFFNPARQRSSDPSFEPWSEQERSRKWLFDDGVTRIERTKMSDPLKTRWELRFDNVNALASYNLKIIGGVWDLQRNLREQRALGRQLVAATRDGLPVRIAYNGTDIAVFDLASP